MPEHAGANLQRLMADAGLSIGEAAQQTGVDVRTIRSLLDGQQKPHARTLHRLAQGLGVGVEEFFVDPARLLYRRFDRQTNPMVEEVLAARLELFDGWTEADFDELHSRMGTGGGLSFEGTVVAVGQMNRKRQLHDKLDLLLETSQAELIGGMIELAYRQVAIEVDVPGAEGDG